MKTGTINRILSLGNYILVDDERNYGEKNRDVKYFAVAISSMGITILAVLISLIMV